MQFYCLLISLFTTLFYAVFYCTVDKSVVHHLDSMVATPANMQPQHMLSNNTDVSNITMTPRWTKYLDRTYNLRSAKQRYTPTCSVVIFFISTASGKERQF